MGTILIVDDEFGIGEVLNAVLTDAGHRVVTAINGRQGLQRLAEVKADLVLLDFMMPVMDGAGMCRAMAADPALRDIPIIMMSALPENVVAKECGGYAAFLSKPFRFETAIRAITRVLADLPPGTGRG